MVDKHMLRNVIYKTIKEVQNVNRNVSSLGHWGQLSFIKVSLDLHHHPLLLVFVLSFLGGQGSVG